MAPTSVRTQAESIVLDRFSAAATHEIDYRMVERSATSQSPAFLVFLDEIEVAAPSCAQGLCAGLFAWRASSPGGSHSSSGAESLPAADGKSVAADAVLADTLARVLSGSHGGSVGAELQAKVEDFAVGRVMLGASDEASSEALLGKLSRHRLLPILHKLRDASCAASAPKGGMLRVASAMGKLEPSVETAATVSQAAEAVGVMLRLSSSKGGARKLSAEGKHALLNALAAVLARVAAAGTEPPGAAADTWQAALQQAWARAEAMAHKPKHLAVAFPLLAAVLAAAPAAHLEALAPGFVRDQLAPSLAGRAAGAAKATSGGKRIAGKAGAPLGLAARCFGVLVATVVRRAPDSAPQTAAALAAAADALPYACVAAAADAEAARALAAALAAAAGGEGRAAAALPLEERCWGGLVLRLLRGAPAQAPPHPSRTNWTRLVPRPVLTGNVSSLSPY